MGLYCHNLILLLLIVYTDIGGRVTRMNDKGSSSYIEHPDQNRS